MTCPKCRIKMREQKRSFHKQRKWVCPRCKRVRMEPANPKGIDRPKRR